MPPHVDQLFDPAITVTRLAVFDKGRSRADAVKTCGMSHIRFGWTYLSRYVWRLM